MSCSRVITVAGESGERWSVVLCETVPAQPEPSVFATVPMRNLVMVVPDTLTGQSA